MNNKVVFYPGNGLAEIISRDDKFVYLFVKRTRLKLTVPHDKFDRQELRSLSSKEIVSKSITMVSEKTPRPHKNWNQRQREYNAIISAGNLELIAKVASEIKTHPEPSFGEKKILTTCLNLIQDEAELVLGSKVSLV